MPVDLWFCAASARPRGRSRQQAAAPHARPTAADVTFPRPPVNRLSRSLVSYHLPAARGWAGLRFLRAQPTGQRMAARYVSSS